MALSRRDFLAASAAFLGACSTRGHKEAAVPDTSTTTSDHPATTSPSTTAEADEPIRPVVARFVRSGPATGTGVAFTFHGSGDPGLFRKLLDVARTEETPITVFGVGNWLEANPDLGQAALTAGHELANHTYTHPSMAGLGANAVATEITKCRDILTRDFGLQANWFRPSGVETPSQVVLAEAGRAGYATVVGYDLDPLDYQDPGAAAIVERVKAGLHRGAIVSLHTGHAGTVAAFAPMIEAVRAGGLRPMLIRDLLNTVP